MKGNKDATCSIKEQAGCSILQKLSGRNLDIVILNNLKYIKPGTFRLPVLRTKPLSHWRVFKGGGVILVKKFGGMEA